MVDLRPYQRQAIDAVKTDWSNGITDCLGVAATGAGKTVITLQLLDEVLTPGKRGVFLAHREELIQQPLERIEKYWPMRRFQTGIVKAAQDEVNRDLVIASVQTLAQEKRLARYLAYGAPDYVVVDECHHANASTYLEIIQAFKAANPNLRHLGVTATPKRSDGDGLSRVYQKVSFKLGIKELIGLGYLVPFKALGVQTGISLKGVRTKDGDYEQKKLSNVFECDNVFDLVAASHQKYAGDRQAIAFTVSVAGAYHLAETFQKAGIPAIAADGTTSRQDRTSILKDFRRGKYKVLVNCALFTEGLDVPEIACVHMVRPTKSDLIYIQSVGRGLRTFPSKPDCLILDYAPIETRDIVMAGDLLGKPKEQRKAEEKAAEEGVIVEGFSFTGEGTGIDGDPDEIIVRELDFLSRSPWAWFHSHGIATLGLGQKDGANRTLAIVPGRKNAYGLVLLERANGAWVDEIRVIDAGDDLSELLDIGASYASEHGVEALAGKGKHWHREPATDGQVKWLRRLIPEQADNLGNVNRGDATKLITHWMAYRALERRGWLAVVQERSLVSA